MVTIELSPEQYVTLITQFKPIFGGTADFEDYLQKIEYAVCKGVPVPDLLDLCKSAYEIGYAVAKEEGK